LIATNTDRLTQIGSEFVFRWSSGFIYVNQALSAAKWSLHSRRLRVAAAKILFVLPLAFFLAGCGSPSAANILLRKQNQSLSDQVDKLNQQHARDTEALAACQRSHPTTASLSPDRLAELFTTHGLSFGRLTGGDNPDPTQNVDSQLKIYVVPIDGDSVPIKAAGTFKVEAFDLGAPDKTLVGTWNFDLTQIRNLFYSQLSMYTYVLPCPLQKMPSHANLTIRVTFDDALTGGEFVQQTNATVRLPTTGP
jgi:hypothetical protein